MATCCAGQITSQTLLNMMMPRIPPAAMAVPGTDEKYSRVSESLKTRIRMPVSTVNIAPQRNHHSARQVTLRMASERPSPLISANAGTCTKLK